MTRQGRCVLRPDRSGRILDRLAGLKKVITPALVRQALFVTGRHNPRACKLTHEVMLWVVLAMGILTDLPIRQVFKHARLFRQWYEWLLWELSQERTEPRRNRINPRVIKQKVSKWRKKRPEHCHPPPLTKIFAEAVVMAN